MSWFDDDKKRPTPSRVLKKLVYERDKGICRLCHKPVDQWDFDIGHDKAHSKGGKLTLNNAILLHPLCNRSMQTLSLKQGRKILGLPSETSEDKTKKALKGLTVSELKYLSKKHRIQVKGRSSGGLFSSSKSSPSKVQYVNALSKVLKEGSISKELKGMPKPTKKKRKKSSFW